MANWIGELTQNIAVEFEHKPVVITLGTVRYDNAPDARSVVMRKLFDDGRLLVTSDARSEKNAQLKSNPAAVVVVWLPGRKKQFRLDGTIEILKHDDALRAQAWKDSSDSARALFAWPACGRERTDMTDTSFPRMVAVDDPMPANFEVLIFSPRRADVLDLNPHPHLRRSFCLKEQDWNESVLNP